MAMRNIVLIALATVVGCQSSDQRAKSARVPWTTSHVVGQPDPPPPYKCAVAFPNLKFHHPLLIKSAPGTDRLFVGEQEGVLWSFPNQKDAKADVFFNLKKDLKYIGKHPGAKEFEFVYGLAFHPKFVENRECFVCYTMRGKKGERVGTFDPDHNLPDGTRVSRFKVSKTDPPQVIPESEEIIITWVQGEHNGGDVHFGPDGYLYISTGDAAQPNPPDRHKTGQDISDLLSSVLRIDVDHKDPGLNYAVPKDNPFIDFVYQGKPARPEVWAYGFRNPWRMSFDRKTGELWVGDVGWELWEMVHKPTKGSNHGWSIVEARQPVNPTWPQGPTPIRPPVIELDHSLAASVTGGYVYRGTKLPALAGKYVFGDWSSRRFWAATVNGDQLVSLEELVDPTVRVVAFGEDHAGELYFLDYDAGTVHTLEPNAATAYDPKAFPRTLSQTGLFKSAKDHTVADGVYKYEVISPQWQDGATAERFVALPGTSSVIDNAERKSIPGNVDWHQFKFHFPKNAVLVKTITHPDGKTRIETQLLHFDGEIWRGYSYAWRDDQTDADLVPADGAEKTYKVEDRFGKHDLNWTFHSRQQCIICHHFWAEFAMGFKTPQLNREIEVGVSKKNQLVYFSELGLLSRKDRQGKPQPPYTPETAARQQKITDPQDMAAKIEDRVKGYFHANCGHCHMFGGGGAVDFELHAFGDLKKNTLYDAPPTRGTFDLTDPKVVCPGVPERSVLYYRMAKFGGARMPHLGSEWPDEFGLSLVDEWIRATKTMPEKTVVWDPQSSLKNPTDAIFFARIVASEISRELSMTKSILATAAKLPPGNVRDLFEGYLPSDGKPRKLGTNPRPRAILPLKGDAANGKAIFFDKRSTCSTCHKIDGQGQEVGPDLSAIAKTRTREFLLESILEPSRRVEQQYQNYTLRTLSGLTHTGLLVKKDESGVTVKTAENKLVTVPAKDVDTFDMSPKSLMPDGLLRDFTAQEAADLLEYLATRK
jgi:putative heme-binding domain-containing protein